MCVLLHCVVFCFLVRIIVYNDNGSHDGPGSSCFENKIKITNIYLFRDQKFFNEKIKGDTVDLLNKVILIV